MYSSDAEIRHTNRSYPDGGVAPSRHALALHDYMERKKKLAARSSTLPLTAALGSVLSQVVARLTTLCGRIGAFSTAGRRVARYPAACAAWVIYMLRH